MSPFFYIIYLYSGFGFLFYIAVFWMGYRIHGGPSQNDWRELLLIITTEPLKVIGCGILMWVIWPAFIYATIEDKGLYSLVYIFKRAWKGRDVPHFWEKVVPPKPAPGSKFPPYHPLAGHRGYDTEI